MRISAIIAALSFLWTGSAEASSWRSRTYPNISLTVLAIAQAPGGLLWLAAKDGLYRFDGFHYQKIQQYPFPSARFVAATEDGSIWAGDYEGLARLHQGAFQIVLRDGVVSMAASADQVFVRLADFALMRIKLDGTLTRISFPVRRDLTLDSAGRLWGVCMRPDSACWMDPAHPGIIHTMPLAPGYEEAVADDEGNVWAASDTQAVMLKDGRMAGTVDRRASGETSRAGPLVIGAHRRFWILGDTVRSPSGETAFRNSAPAEPLCGLEDRRGHFWMWLAGRGLVELIPDSQVQRWTSRELGGEILDFVIRDQRGQIVLATHKNLYRFDGANQSWIASGREEHRYDGLAALDDGTYVASIRDLGVARLSANGRITKLLASAGAGTEDPHFRKVLRDSRGRIWISAKRGLFRVDTSNHSLRLRIEFLPGMKPEHDQQAVDLELDREGRLWVGYMNGIAWLDDNDVWHRVESGAAVTAVRSFSPGTGDIWVAHRVPGAFTHMVRVSGDRWTVNKMNAAAGYAPGDTEFIQQDSRGWIWRGTTEGVFVADGRHLAPEDWIHLTTDNPLANGDSNQYGFLEEPGGGAVWIVAEQGVTRLRPDPSWFAAPSSAPKPYLTRFEADGRNSLFPVSSSTSFPADLRLLRIDVGSFDAPPFRDAPLRYRMVPAVENWRPSSDGRLEFRNLHAGQYRLEIGYAGQGPSAVAVYPFAVGAPRVLSASGGRWPFVLGTILALAMIPPVLRFVPAFAGPSFRLDKALFVLRRRFTARGSQRAERGEARFVNHTGELALGRYRLERILSYGGFSVVYEASDTEQNAARCAVKVLTPSETDQGWIRDRFAHEVSALRTVKHANIVEILDSWISPDGEPCIAMPFLDGPTLRALLAEKRPDLQRVALLTEQMAAGLMAVHARGIVHRDLKPENMIVLGAGTSAERLVIIDFGTASLRTGEGRLAATTLMAGSFHYMAPERLSGHFSLASDVFSFAVVILEMLTGWRLFEVGALHSAPDFRPAIETALKKNIDGRKAVELAGILIPAFDPDPRKRPLDATTWAAEIARILRGQA